MDVAYSTQGEDKSMRGCVNGMFIEKLPAALGSRSYYPPGNQHTYYLRNQFSFFLILKCEVSSSQAILNTLNCIKLVP